MSERNGSDQFVFDLSSDDTCTICRSLRVLQHYQEGNIMAEGVAAAFGGFAQVVHMGLPVDPEITESFDAGEFDSRLIELIGHEVDRIAFAAAQLLVNKTGGYQKMVCALLGIEDDDIATDAREEDSLASTLVDFATGSQRTGDTQTVLQTLLMNGVGTCANEVFTALRKKLRNEETSTADEREPVAAS